MKFSFVIPAYNHFDLLHKLLFDIYKNCSKVHEVIIVDDDSSDSSFLSGLAWWTSNGMLPIKHIRPIDNLGFLKASNKGLKEATGDVVCLVSTDVQIHKDIVKEITNYLESPLSTLIGGRLLDFDTGWNTFNGKTFFYLEGWLLASTKDVWEALGYFDERYCPNDYEDIDLSVAAYNKGCLLISLAPEDVTHIGAQSIPYGDERSKLTERNREKFKEKWIK